MSLFEGNLWGRAGKRKPQNFGIQTHLKGESRLRLEQPSQSRRQDTNTSAFPTFWVFLFHSSSFPPMQGQIPTGVGSELLVLWVWTWGTRQDRILLGITALPTFWIFLSCSCSLLPPPSKVKSHQDWAQSSWDGHREAGSRGSHFLMEFPA